MPGLTWRQVTTLGEINAALRVGTCIAVHSTSRFRVASALMHRCAHFPTVGHTFVSPGEPAALRDRGHEDERALQPLALHAIGAAAARGRRRQRLAPRGPCR